ncbi:hypothetical protein PsYK624_143700 [Phanerochaete sordida]|uniref:Uncharacterized protein n=1 Tax=Phanerochaete sordida TaxID=48140 RepID=A0A9P3GLS6_9APHY|nr:hypothetical protein PsYK624_143700 [Phanerochaete sordida]
MQALRFSARTSVRAVRALPRVTAGVRALSTAPSSSSSPEHQRPVPWFVDPSDHPHAGPSTLASPASQSSAPPLPASLPSDHPVAALHAQLLASPHLEHEFLTVREPIPTESSPLPDAPARGRRKRGRTYAGESVAGEIGVGLWRWILVAQVKEGSENRGAIESVARVVRKLLLSVEPPLPLAQKRRRPVTDGWLMVDAGDFAVHIVSRTAREQFFPDRRAF